MGSKCKITLQSICKGTHTGKGRILQTIYHRKEGRSHILWGLKVQSGSFILTVVGWAPREDGHDVTDAFKRPLLSLCGGRAGGRQE